MTRLFTAHHISTPRASQPLLSSDLHTLRCWMPASTFDQLMSISESPALTLLHLYEKPSKNKLRVSFSEPRFFDESEHFHVSFNYHTEDLSHAKS